jgi:hypothetical protein
MGSAHAIPGLLAAAQACVKNRPSGHYDIDFQRSPRDQQTAELAALNQDHILAQELVGIIYGDGIPPDVTFYEPLIHFAGYLTFGDQAKEIVGIIWAKAFTLLGAAQVEGVLLELPSLGQPYGLMLESLPHLVRRQYLSTNMVLRVSEVIAKHNEGTFGPGLDRALEAFAERQPDEAVVLLSDAKPTEDNFWIFSIVLGRLRISRHAATFAATVI